MLGQRQQREEPDEALAAKRRRIDEELCNINTKLTTDMINLIFAYFSPSYRCSILAVVCKSWRMRVRELFRAERYGAMLVTSFTEQYRECRIYLLPLVRLRNILTVYHNSLDSLRETLCYETPGFKEARALIKADPTDHLPTRERMLLLRTARDYQIYRGCYGAKHCAHSQRFDGVCIVKQEGAVE